VKFGIVFGGVSFEHEISIVSAVALKGVMKDDLTFVFVDKDRSFYLIEPQNMRANYFSSGKYKESKKLILTRGGFATHGLLGVKLVEVDSFVNLIHGADGEDGKLAGLFEFYGVRFVGPRLEASVMSFSKVLTKYLALKCGVKTLEFEVIHRGEKPKMPLPYILKPARLGSSIGVGVVRSESELNYALDVAFEFDSEVVVEPFKEGIREFNLAGYAGENGEVKFSFVEEPAKKEFLDFDQKYTGFTQKKIGEAEISGELKANLQDAFRKLYTGGGFFGALIRCDFFEENGEIYLNEINPNPGSLANYLFADFNEALRELSRNLPSGQKINVEYNFINQITSAKGKLA